MSEKLRATVDGHGQSNGHLHFCPGCDDMHRLPPGWAFNGDLVKPTYSPSFKHTWGRHKPGQPEKCCHYILTDGVLNFCGDSTHALAGQSVPLPPIPERYADWGR
ncbi:MAG: DUF6527 family protein [Magnetospirillum sp.]|nr:DUF6527 family protein [Magnetospirillum sp.]